jgi:hypothetical protein
MDFAQTQRRFAELDGAYRQGHLDAAAYASAVGRLRVTDAAGQVWQIQAHSGQWHVLRQGQWVAAVPPAYLPGYAPDAPPAQPARRRGPGWPAWLATGIAGGSALGLCALVVAAILLVQSGRLPNPLATARGTATPATLAKSTIPATPGAVPSAAATPGAIPPAAAKPSGVVTSLTFRTTQAVVAAADGKAYTDRQGVSLIVPKGTLSGTVGAELEASAASGALLDAIGKKYAMDSPFYRAYGQGGNSGRGGATISFATANPASRLLAVIDGEFVVPLPAVPLNGAIALPVRLGPQDAGGLPWVGAGEAGNDLRYVLVTPKMSAAPGEQPAAGRGVAGLAAPAAQDDYRAHCSNDDKDLPPICFSPGGDVSVVWSRYLLPDFPEDSGYKLALAVREIMKRYAAEGFEVAKFPVNHYVMLRVTGTGSTPAYSVQSQVLYIPLDIARNVVKGEVDHALMHELAHWIEHEAYWMWLRGFGSGFRWWIEMAAENMVMLLDPSYATLHLAKYGKQALPDGTLVLQHAAYEWIWDEGYVQAHLVRVNMCDSSVCPFSKASFVDAINQGTYPLDDAGARLLVSGNQKDFARYLLGAAPLVANKSATVAAQTGAEYSQYINVVKNVKGDFIIDRLGEAPQIVRVGDGMQSAATIRAPLERDGVYPLYLASGAGGNTASYPVQLRVQPGVELMYRLGDGEPYYYDGKKELVIGPIHKTMGAPDLRLVAMGKTSGQVFQARVEVVDLQGAWLVTPKKVLQSSIACSNVKPGDTASLDANSAATLHGWASAMGRYALDASGKTLVWVKDPDAIAAISKTIDFQMSGTVDLGMDGMRLRANVDVPKKTNSLPLGLAWGPPADAPMEGAPPLALGLALVGPPAAVLSWRASRKRLALVCMVAAIAVLVTGCLGIYGTIGSDLVFTKMEYQGGQETAVIKTSGFPTTMPLWVLNGKGTYSTNVNVVVGTKDNPRTEVCAGSTEVEVEARIYKSARIQQ